MPSLSDQEIQQIYDLLAKMYVPLEEQRLPDLTYVRERMGLCRAMQDQCSDLRVKTLRAYSWVQETLIYTQSQLRLADSEQAKDQLKLKVEELKQQKVSHATLSRLVGLQHGILMQTQRDIKTLTDIVKSQIKLGEEGGVNPHEAEEALIQQVDVGSIGLEPEEESQPLDARVQEAAPVTAPADPALDGLFATTPARVMAPPAAAENVSFEGFDTVVTAVEAAPRGIPVADTSGVPIESLFEMDEESPNGDGNHHAAPAPAYRAF